MSAILSLATHILSSTNPIIIALVVILISLGLYIALSPQKQDTDDVYEEQNLSLNQLLSSLSVYSRRDVAKHNDETDCWVTIDNFVYDLTPFIPRHPGGMKVLKLRAGQDCTMGFHGFQHPENAYTNLKDYLIGRLPNEEFVRWIDAEDVKKNGWFEYNGAVYSKDVKSAQDQKANAASLVGYVRNPIPIEMVHTHDQEKDCWIIINDKIYDVTHWALEHPGGSIITSKPGEDVSAEFSNNHGGNENVKEIMERYYVAPVLVK